MKNVLESVVAREYERLRRQVDGFCGCDRCRDDVIVFALNRLPPRYVAAEEGEVITNVRLGADQPMADVAVALLDGFRRVALNPRAGHSKTS